MISIISGCVMAGAGAAGLWFAMPKNGEVQNFAKHPLFDWLIPTAIVAALAIGVALVMSGLIR
jgi:hypothetical protein